MTEIKNVSQTQLTHTELAETADNYLNIIKTHLAGSTFLMSLLPVILMAVEKMRSALGAIRANALVKQTFDLDQVRDNRFVMLRDMIAAFEKTDIPEEKEAYELLWPVFVKVGIRLYTKGYLEQSARLEVLFQEFDKPEYQAAMDTLGVKGRYANLKTAEEDFKAIYDDRLEEDTKINYPTLREARLELSPLVADLIPTLRNVARTAEEGADLSWMELINEQTDRVMTQVAARRTRKNTQEEERETEE